MSSRRRLSTRDRVRERLLALQSDDEVFRKAQKARRRSIWTQEDLDWARRWGKRMAARIKWNHP